MSCWIFWVWIRTLGHLTKGRSDEVKLWTGCHCFARREWNISNWRFCWSQLQGSILWWWKTTGFLFHQNIAQHVYFAGKSVNHGLCLTLTSGSGGVVGYYVELVIYQIYPSSPEAGRVGARQRCLAPGVLHCANCEMWEYNWVKTDRALVFLDICYYIKAIIYINVYLYIYVNHTNLQASQFWVHLNPLQLPLQ